MKVCERYNMSTSDWILWNIILWWVLFCFIWTYMSLRI